MGRTILPIAALALATSACRSVQWPIPPTQRWPGPMEPLVEPLPDAIASDYVPGPEEVEVSRYSDPVRIRRAGTQTTFPLAFYEKKERVNSGAWVITGTNGRAELAWPRDGTRVVLFGDGACMVGEPSRDEPQLVFHELTRAHLFLTPEDRIELLGGAIVSGDPDVNSGPYLVERLRPDLMRVVNQSKTAATIEYLDVEIQLGPGQLVDLPLLTRGIAPYEPPSPDATIQGPGFDARVLGAVAEPWSGNGRLRLEATEETEVDSLGVRVRLGAGRAVTLDGLAQPRLSVGPETERVEHVDRETR